MTESKHSNLELEKVRHSAAHLMAAAVQKLYPEVKFGVGPVTEDGFYYDLDLPFSLTPESLDKIEKTMQSLQKEDLDFIRTEVPVEQAAKNAESLGQPYKAELIRDLASEGEKKVSFYKTGEFIDLCAGPHVAKTSEVGPYKLLSVSTAYWKGDQAKPQLQRIYGTAWETKPELEDYLKRVEEAKLRDHKKLGLALDLFHFEEYSPSSAYWHPKGMIIYRELEKYAREIEGSDYQEVKAPELVSADLFKKSGHIQYYEGDMFKVKDGEKEYYLKPMNCPETLLIFKARKRSYRELPMRLSCFDNLHRTERSGVFHGLTRVKEFIQDDGHIICTLGQAEEEFAKLLAQTKEVHNQFGFKSVFKLATRPDAFMGEKSDWDRAEEILKSALAKSKLGYDVKEKDATFYGPKIDVYALDALGREWQLTTLQLDLQQPAGLGARFTDEDGVEKTPIMIHRAMLGSLERFIGVILEHYGGNLPTWLSPVQAIVIPITDAQNSYAKDLHEKLQQEGIRSEIDLRGEKMGAKIRDAQIQKIPYMLIIGEREIAAKGVAVRLRDGTDLKTIPLGDILTRIKEEVARRS
ncbi:MAG TPA: threonine--tRNA ligase [Patescibacteria group bacterium]|nr:threonine--tRNA ligase [Patescibacteria group bacterium]